MNLLIIAKVTLIFAVCLLMLTLMRKASAALRHVVVAAALSAALVLPILEYVAPAWEVLPKPDLSQPVTSPKVAEAVGNDVDSGRKILTPERILTTGGMTPPMQKAKSLIPVLWSSVALSLLALLLLRIIGMCSVTRNAQVLSDSRLEKMLRDACRQLDIRQGVQIRIRDSASMPAAWGIFRPVVLLPRDCIEWPDARCRDVLAHELAHIVRRDVAIKILGHLVCALHWFNPLVWILKRKLEFESELACDDLALAQGVPASGYANSLLGIATEFHRQPGLAPVMAARSKLEERIMAILETKKNRSELSLRTQFAVTLISVAVVLPLSSLTWAQSDAVLGVESERNSQVERSDSRAFANHLQETGIAKDDADALLIGIVSTNALTRAASAWALGDIEDPRVINPLTQAGYDTDAVVRQWAIRSLASWVTPDVGQMLIDKLQDGDAEVRQWAVRTLDLHEPAVKAPPLISVLADDDVEVREWTVRALAEVDDPNTRAALADRLAVESNPAVIEWLVRGMDSANLESVDALINATDNPSADVREWAVRGLSGNLDDRTVNTLITMLGDEDANVREWSARGLGVCGNERAVAPLNALQEDSSADVQEWASRSLEEIACMSRDRSVH